MDIKEQLTPEKLERFSFLWSEARLIIAALSLLIGGTPVLYRLLMSSGFYSVVTSILTLSWIISGLAAGYLLYRWFTGGQTLFGEKRTFDKYAFAVSVISGVHLGIAGFTSANIGMSLVSGVPVLAQIVYLAAAVAYVASAVWLFKRWYESEQKLFVAPSE